MSRSFKIENNEVRMYSEDGGYMGSLGTLLPNNEQILRVIVRAYGTGRLDMKETIRQAIGG